MTSRIATLSTTALFTFSLAFTALFSPLANPTGPASAAGDDSGWQSVSNGQVDDDSGWQ